MKQARNPQQLLLDLAFPKEYCLSSLIEGESNQNAIELIKTWPNWPSQFVAIVGEAGCGKTHLGHIWQQKSDALWIDSLDLPQTGSLYEAKNIVIDDADKINNDEWLFHAYNIAKENGASFLVLANVPPSQWEVKLKDLKSRLGTFLCLEIASPDDVMLKTLMIKLFFENGLRPNAEVIEYLVKRIPRSYVYALEAVGAINAYTMKNHRDLTIPVVREALLLGQS